MSHYSNDPPAAAVPLFLYHLHHRLVLTVDPPLHLYFLLLLCSSFIFSFNLSSDGDGSIFRSIYDTLYYSDKYGACMHI